MAHCRDKPIARQNDVARQVVHAQLKKRRKLALAGADVRIDIMPSRKQKRAARRNIKKAARAAKRKRTIAHLPKRTRTALGKKGAKAAKRKRR